MGSSRGHLGTPLKFDFRLFDWRDAIRGALVTALITSAPVLASNVRGLDE
jgi:hypothetical protein